MTNRNVYLVDDEDSVRESAELLLDVAGYEVEAFSSGSRFLEHLATAAPGCVVLDIHMPGLSGLDVLRIMRERGCDYPVIILTGQGDVGMAVQAMKGGAADFLEKPYRNETLLATIHDALHSLDASLEEREKVREARAKVEALSRREVEVLRGLLAALPNKLIAHQLGLSVRTVEVYRANIMDKLGARGLSMAVRIALLAGLEPLGETAHTAVE
jgi:two-component system response regulator FixJ